MTATLEVRFERLDAERLAAVTAVCEAAAPGAWVTEERRAGFWTAHAAPAQPVFSVTVYLADDTAGALRLAAIERGLAARGDLTDVVPAVLRRDAAEDWSEAWKQPHRPLDIGRRLRVVPAWDDAPAPAGRVVVRLEPGRAFGLGSHPTTRLALELLEVALRPGDRVADVGCGSGILSVAALRLGAAFVAACDIDPTAVEATVAAGRDNGVADRLEVVAGGPEALHGGPFDCVVVNVVAEVLRELLAAVAALAGEAGRVVIAGMRLEQAGDLGARLARQGLAVSERREANGFAAMIAAREGGGGPAGQAGAPAGRLVDPQ